MSDIVRIGVLSDTHGRLPRAVFARFEGVQRILHAGDVGDPSILADLGTIAPVTAVWGNTDGFDIRSITTEEARLVVGGTSILMVHGHMAGSPNPQTLARHYEEGDVVIFGHSHRPLIERHAGRLYLNPGSAGAPRFGVAASVALLTIGPGGPDAELLPLGG